MTQADFCEIVKDESRKVKEERDQSRATQLTGSTKHACQYPVGASSTFSSRERKSVTWNYIQQPVELHGVVLSAVAYFNDINVIFTSTEDRIRDMGVISEGHSHRTVYLRRVQ